eukprot:655358-Rhodomonas_salina.1
MGSRAEGPEALVESVLVPEGLPEGTLLGYVGAQSFGYDQDESAFIAPSYNQYQPTYEQQTFDQQEQ